MKKAKIQLSRISVFLIIISLCLCAAGIFTGDTQDIFRKAVFICMECIGLG